MPAGHQPTGLLLLDQPVLSDLMLWGGAALLGLLTAVGWTLAEEHTLPQMVSISAFAVSANIAALVAGVRALRGELDPIREPARRPGAWTEMVGRRNRDVLH